MRRTDGAGELGGRVALVTGAARGMGAAEARLLHAAGAAVVLTDVLGKEGAELATELGDDALFVHHDVTLEEHWRAVVSSALGRFGRLDILVNNAGTYSTRPLLEETVERFERLYRVNLIGPFLGIQTVAPVLREAGGGTIVNISSTAGMTAFPEHAAYGASKWALRGLTRTAALELGPHGIRVNSVYPGAVSTPMIAGVVQRAQEENTAGPSPLMRFGEPREVAELVLFLASDRSSYVNGGEFVVDGGTVAGLGG
ncbi:glucose 1-dehydrogenase [Streptomyces malaysiensis]|uniref:Uncharacterized protein n=1 Tax=Streptomyces malaysiensis TaxID=92644 RepID=A0A7X5X1Q9_STRMQ|nr:glucose 1-dehydrogenase [Streptomyces malaysiensis]NIY64240.1 hypothetical protein [Streptomyces malaysiensis]